MPTPMKSCRLGIRLVTQAVNFGMMSGAALPPQTSRAHLIRDEFDAATATNRWQIRFEQVDTGVFFVILNLLRARRLDSFSLQTMDSPPDAPLLDFKRLVYPGRYRQLPFVLNQSTPLRATRDRKLEIMFEEPPTDELREFAMRAMDVWGNLLILAAYARRDRHPRQACTLPDLPYWLDEVTLVEPFEEFFDSDEACFSDGELGGACSSNKRQSPRDYYPVTPTPCHLLYE